MKQEMTDKQLVETVAEKIMGWHMKYAEYYSHANWWLDSNDKPQFAVTTHDTGEYEFRVTWEEFDPINDPADWWMVVERMLSKDFNHRFYSHATGHESLFVKGMEADNVKGRAFHKNPGRAVAISALDAMEKE